MVRSKNASPTWSDVRTALLDFDRAALRGLVQDLYAASEDNQAFLHARLGLGQKVDSEPTAASGAKRSFMRQVATTKLAVDHQIEHG